MDRVKRPESPYWAIGEVTLSPQVLETAASWDKNGFLAATSCGPEESYQRLLLGRVLQVPALTLAAHPPQEVGRNQPSTGRSEETEKGPIGEPGDYFRGSSQLRSDEAGWISAWIFQIPQPMLPQTASSHSGPAALQLGLSKFCVTSP